jgi:hypothetical protein
MTNCGPAPCSLSSAAFYSAFRSASSRTAVPARILYANKCSPVSSGLVKFFALLSKTKQPHHPLRFCPARIIGSIYGACLLVSGLSTYETDMGLRGIWVATAGCVETPACPLSFCASDERPRSEPAAPATDDQRENSGQRRRCRQRQKLTGTLRAAEATRTHNLRQRAGIDGGGLCTTLLMCNNGHELAAHTPSARRRG